MSKKEISVAIQIGEDRLKVLLEKAMFIYCVAKSFLDDFCQGSKAEFHFDDTSVKVEWVNHGIVRLTAFADTFPLRNDYSAAHFTAFLDKDNPLWKMNSEATRYRSTYDILIAIEKAVVLHKAMEDSAKEIR